MLSDLPCAGCEKLVVELQSVDELHRLTDAPTTYDRGRGVYVWKEFDLMKYALIPRSVGGTKAWVDLYVCMDEDDLDDIDLYEYIESFFKVAILPVWPAFTVTHIVPPYEERPEQVECWKIAEQRKRMTL